MGVLRTFLSKFFRFKPDPNLVSPVCTHSNLPQQHQHTKLVANANDHCHSCSQRICLVCSEVHIRNHCQVDLSVNKEAGEGTLKDFNQGYLMKLPLNGLKCICGKPLGNGSGHALCSACGVATCSDKCHDDWQAQGNCTYASNYFQKPKEITMRSILFSNIRNVQVAKIGQWNLACKNALSYIACYAKAGANHIYLQRGYRNYGRPQNQLLDMMTKVQFGLDYTTHIERVCLCQCDHCVKRGFHSIGNCEFDCVQTSYYNAFQYKDDASMYHQCTCDCSFCRSGVVVSRHAKIDCGLFCYKSDFNVEKVKRLE